MTDSTTEVERTPGEDPASSASFPESARPGTEPDATAAGPTKADAVVSDASEAHDGANAEAGAAPGAVVLDAADPEVAPAADDPRALTGADGDATGPQPSRAPKRAVTPAHLWVAGGVAILANLLWLGHALLSLSGSSALFKALGYGRDQIDYFTAYPWLPAVFWALAIGAGFAGAIALLRRRASAVPLLLGSVLSQVILYALSVGLLNSAAILGPVAGGLTVAAIAIGLGLAGYAWWARRRGILS